MAGYVCVLMPFIYKSDWSGGSIIDRIMADLGTKRGCAGIVSSSWLYKMRKKVIRRKEKRYEKVQLHSKG